MGVKLLYWLLIIVVILVVYFMYYLIGLLFDTDMFNAVTLQENGFTISFIGIILLAVTSFFILKFIDKYILRNNK